jgi:hypothetical protein
MRKPLGKYPLKKRRILDIVAMGVRDRGCQEWISPITCFGTSGDEISSEIFINVWEISL